MKVFKPEQDKLFLECVQENKIALHRLAYSILKNEQDAQDAVAEALTQAYAHQSDLRNRQSMRAWLFKILVNQCYSMIKQMEKERKLIEQLQNDLKDTQSMEESSASEVDLWELVLQLPENLRVISVLYYFEQWKLREIAKTLSLPEGTVKSRLARSRRILRDRIESMDNRNAV